MCDFLDFLIAPWRILWQHIYANWCNASFRIVPAEHVKLLNAASSRSLHNQKHSLLSDMKSRAKSSSYGLTPVGSGMCAMVAEHGEGIDFNGKLKKRKTERRNLSCNSQKTSTSRCLSSGASSIASLFTKRGQKGINQDAMLLIEDFASRADTVFCGVFDGHGPHGHFVAKNVGDILPEMLASCWQAAFEVARSTSSLSEEVGDDSGKESIQDEELIGTWEDSFVKAYKLMDRELLLNKRVDCVSSGTTAVTVVKQGYDLILGNVGDSRAILGSTAEDGSLVAIQLTVDLKPDVPREAERIKRLKGRVFALQNEPSVMRVWLPNLNAPGLAMTRALGDYCLKNHGVISEPVVSHRRLTSKDKFIVLATDGVWDVLSNQQVVETVALAPLRSLAGKAVVDAAVHAWKSNYMTSKVDDCAVICLFLDNLSKTS